MYMEEDEELEVEDIFDEDGSCTPSELNSDIHKAFDFMDKIINNSNDSEIDDEFEYEDEENDDETKELLDKISNTSNDLIVADVSVKEKEKEKLIEKLEESGKVNSKVANTILTSEFGLTEKDVSMYASIIASKKAKENNTDDNYGIYLSKEEEEAVLNSRIMVDDMSWSLSKKDIPDYVNKSKYKKGSHIYHVLDEDIDRNFLELRDKFTELENTCNNTRKLADYIRAFRLYLDCIELVCKKYPSVDKVRLSNDILDNKVKVDGLVKPSIYEFKKKEYMKIIKLDKRNIKSAYSNFLKEQKLSGSDEVFNQDEHRQYFLKSEIDFVYLLEYINNRDISPDELVKMMARNSVIKKEKHNKSYFKDDMLLSSLGIGDDVDEILEKLEISELQNTDNKPNDSSIVHAVNNIFRIPNMKKNKKNKKDMITEIATDVIKERELRLNRMVDSDTSKLKNGVVNNSINDVLCANEMLNNYKNHKNSISELAWVPPSRLVTINNTSVVYVREHVLNIMFLTQEAQKNEPVYNGSLLSKKYDVFLKEYNEWLDETALRYIPLLDSDGNMMPRLNDYGGIYTESDDDLEPWYRVMVHQYPGERHARQMFTLMDANEIMVMKELINHNRTFNDKSSIDLSTFKNNLYCALEEKTKLHNKLHSDKSNIAKIIKNIRVINYAQDGKFEKKDIKDIAKCIKTKYLHELGLHKDVLAEVMKYKKMHKNKKKSTVSKKASMYVEKKLPYSELEYLVSIPELKKKGDK